jgi:L-aspartate oxidase
LVIGAGVAGLRAAIELAPAARVLVVTKSSLTESSSEYAQGGIAVALNDDDTAELHEQDTLAAGDGLCDPAAVRVLVEEGPRRIEELLEWGAEFDRDGSKLSFGREGAHSRNRILHAHGDSTGHEIARALQRKAASLPNVEFRSFAAMTDLLVDEDNRVAGALVLDESSGGQIPVRARAVLLATGGLGRVFRDTTNPTVATGDGVAAAFRAGAEIEDMEFVQFHPTALHLPNAPPFLLSEALRGEGAILRNARGEAFMDRYHPWKDLAPRDVVSRAIVSEIERTGGGEVFLDLTALGRSRLEHHFPRIYSTCLRYHLDLATTPAPVHPAAHYSMGGIRTNLAGATSLSGLYAAGEAACTGVHGANRLASNSLLEGVVFGSRAGADMLNAPPPQRSPWKISLDARRSACSERDLRELAWQSCGIIRNGAALSSAIDQLDRAANGGPCVSVGDYESRNMHAVLSLIAASALARQESRGAHFRTDYPQKDEGLRRHSIVSVGREVRFE